MIWRGVGLLCAVVLTACSGGEADRPPDDAAGNPSTTTSIYAPPECVAAWRSADGEFAPLHCEEYPDAYRAFRGEELAEPEVRLEADGFQGLKFGESANRVVLNLSKLFGAADHDSKPATPQTGFGLCPGQAWRTVRWDSLSVLFIDDGRGLAFAGWHDSRVGDSAGTTRPSVGARTSRGIGVGATVEEVTAKYGDAVRVTRDERTGETLLVFGAEAKGITGRGQSNIVMALENHPCGE